MLNLQDFYILGLPIDTEIGICHFLKVKDYPQYFTHLNALAVTKEAIIYKYYCDKTQDHSETIAILQQLSLFEMIMASQDVLKLYYELFSYMFKNENIFEHVTKDNFEQYRNMLITMNVIKEDIVNPNPEIQYWIEKSKTYASNDDSPITFSDIVSSVAIGGNYTYVQVNNMSLYQLYTSFHRIAKIKNYETSTLFATVSVEKINIEHWCSHIDLFIKEQHGLSQSEYNKKKQELGLK